MNSIENELKAVIRDVHDFPKKGIVFKDITTVLYNPSVSKKIVPAINAQLENLNFDIVIGIDSRGFLFANMLAIDNEKPFVPIRKAGKLPFKKITKEYALEYGTSKIEIHTDAIQPGQKVLIHDDLLATGGTAIAAAELVEELGGEVAGFSFLVNLSFLEGGEKLREFSDNLFALATY